MTGKRGKSKAIVVICICLLSLALSMSAYGKEKVLVIGHGGEPESLFPITASYPIMDRVSNVCERLVGLDPNANAIPLLAEKWGVVEGYKWRFHLRKGVKFHNGEQFSAEDVAFTLDYVKDPKNKSERIGDVRGYRYEVIDEYTIDIFKEKGGFDPILPKAWYAINILPKDTFLKVGADNFSVAPIGTGPFQFVEWKRGSQVVLKAFDGYWGGRPKIDTLIYKTIPEGASRVIGLKTGELDIIADVPPIEIDSISKDKNLEIRKKASLFVIMVQMRCDIPPFKDNLNLRKAVAHAIDSKLICEKVLGGLGVPEGAVTSSDAFGYNKSVGPYEYNPELAKEYLAKSGYKGEQINFCSPNGRYFQDVEIATAIVGYLNAIGIKSELVLNDWPSYKVKYRRKGGAQMEPLFMVGWTNNSGDGVENLFDTAHKDSPVNWHSEKGLPEFFKMVDIARSNPDQEERKKALQNANQMIHDYYYYAMCWSPVGVYGVKKNVSWSPRADKALLVTPSDEKR